MQSPRRGTEVKMNVSESDVSALRSKVDNLRWENSQLQDEINTMVASVNSVSSNVAGVKDTALSALNNGERTINNDNNILHDVGKRQEEIRGMMILYKNMENAYKTIRGLNNELRYHQDGEKNVRKMLVAMLDNETKNLASQDTITEQAEKQYLNTQYFFLSYIMMDLIHTKRGEKEAAQRARKKALEMDERRSIWVYFLIALRRGDNKERDYWVDKLVKTPLIGSEEMFLKVLAVIALCDTGAAADKLRAYIGADKISDGAKGPLVSKISANYASVMKTRPPEFKYINQHIGESEELQGALSGAMNNESVAAYIQKLTGSSASGKRTQFYADVLDEAMDYYRSPKSDEIRDKISYQEKIIEAKGVIERAMELKAKEDVMLVSELDVEGCLFKWLTGNENFVGKKDVNEFSYQKFKASYKQAYREYVKEYRANYSESLTFRVSDYSVKSAFKDVEEDERKIENYLVERCRKTKAAIKDTKFYLGVIFGALLVIAGIVLNFLSSVIPSPWNVVCLVVCVVAGLALVLFGIKVKYSNYKALIRADEALATDRIKFNEVLRCVYTDVASYREMYKAYDAKVMTDKQFD